MKTRRIPILVTAAAATLALTLPSAGAEAPPAGASPDLATSIARARLALAPFATDLRRAKAAGYQIITRMIPDMGWHYMNPRVTTFDVRRPPILVYVKHGRAAQLVAAEWVFPETPDQPPLPGATYGSFGAACHYVDGTFVFEDEEARCARRSPESGARFNFWHPDLVTLHLWLWYPNPEGVFNGTNPLVAPFNEG